MRSEQIEQRLHSLSEFLPKIIKKEDIKEMQLYSILEESYLKEGINFHNIVFQYPLARNRFIDYYGKDLNNIETFIEVKRETTRNKDLRQIIGYYDHIIKTRKKFRFLVLCNYITDDRKKILEKLGIEVILFSTLGINLDDIEKTAKESLTDFMRR